MGGGVLNDMSYIKMSKNSNLDQQGVWLSCKRRGVDKWGCGPRGCGKRGCGLGGKAKNLKWHVVYQNGQNKKCSSVGCVVRLWGVGCGHKGVWPNTVQDWKLISRDPEINKSLARSRLRSRLKNGLLNLKYIVVVVKIKIRVTV